MPQRPLPDDALRIVCEWKRGGRRYVSIDLVGILDAFAALKAQRESERVGEVAPRSAGELFVGVGHRPTIAGIQERIKNGRAARPRREKAPRQFRERGARRRAALKGGDVGTNRAVPMTGELAATLGQRADM